MFRNPQVVDRMYSVLIFFLKKRGRNYLSIFKIINFRVFAVVIILLGRAQCLRTLRRKSAVFHLLGMRVRIPPVALISVCCECSVLSGRGAYDGPIPHPEESYQMCVCVCVCCGAVARCVSYDAHLATAPQHIPTQHDILPQHLVCK